MFAKLALRNVRRSLKDYSVYFITLVFGVCLFYTFNALEGQSVLLFLSQSGHYMVEGILMLMNVFSVFVAVVLACVILYADRFMMKRRKRELGTYLLLGLTGRRVAALLFLETLFIGAAALAVGLAVGVLFSFGLSALSAGLFQVSVDFLKLSFSLKAAAKTVLCFGVVFLLVLSLSGLSVSRCRLIDLMEARRKGEEMKERPLGRAVVEFLAGAALIAGAYALVLTRGLLTIDPLFFLMLAMGAAGTLLFFRSLSGFLLKIGRSSKGVYYRGLNLFTLRQFHSRVHTNYISMTVICLMLLLAIGITASAVGLNNTIAGLAREPFDVTIANYSGDTLPADLEEELTAAGFDTGTEFALAFQFDLYYGDEELGADGAMKLSDYNALLSALGREEISLPGGEGVPGENGLVDGGINVGYLVVPDERAEELSVRRQVLVANYAGSAEESEAALKQALHTAAERRELHLYFFSRMETYLDTLGSKVLVIFLGLYLGAVFLLAAAAVLALQQLTQAADNAHRYALLSGLGADRGQRQRSVFAQVFLAFFLPLALAVVHAAVGMKAANDVIAVAGRVDAAASTAVTALFLVVVYGAYFLVTWLGCRRLAGEN